MNIRPDPVQFSSSLERRVLVMGNALDRTPKVWRLEKSISIATVIKKYELVFNLPTIAVIIPPKGEPYPVLRGEWRKRKLRKGETLAFVGVPGRSALGSSRSVLALVATLALAVVVPFAAPALAVAMGFAASGTAASLIGAGLMLVGAFVISRLLPSAKGPLDDSEQVYTVRNSSNRAMPGEVIPCLYGRLRYPPPYASRPYFEFISNDQYLYQLHCMSVGSVDVTRWEIGDTLVWTSSGGFTDTFKGDIQIQIAQPGQDITLFPINVTTSVAVDGQVVPNPGNWIGPFSANPSGTKINRIAVDFVFAQGLHGFDNKGQFEQRSRGLVAQYREIDDLGNPVGGGSWNTVFSEIYTRQTRTPLRLSREVNVPKARYEVRFGSTTNDLTDSPSPSPTINRANWVGLRGFIHDFQTPAGVTLIATKIRANDQLSRETSGQYLFTGTRMLRQRSGGQWTAPIATRSIAWAAADLLLNTDYGMGYLESEIDLQWLVTYSQVWQNRGDTFDGVFDRQWVARDALNAILKAGRSYAVRMGSRVGFNRDEPKQVRRVAFTPDTVLRGSIRRNDVWFNEDAPDHLRAKFIDENTWIERDVKAIISSVGSERPQVVDFTFGFTNHDHTWREAIFLAAENAYRRSFRTFQVEREGRTLIRGEPVVLHDPLVEAVGFARVNSWNPSNNTIVIDRNFTPKQGETYHVHVRDKQGREWGPCAVSSFNNRNVILNATDRAIVESQHGALSNRLPNISNQEPAHISFLAGDYRLFDGLVVEARPIGTENWEVTLVNDDQRVHLVDGIEVIPAPWTPPNLFAPIPDAPIIRGLFAHAVRSGPKVELDAGWQPSPGAVRYIAEISYDEDASTAPENASWEEAHDSTATRFSKVITPNDYGVTLRVAAIGKRQGPWAYAFVSNLPDGFINPGDLDNIPPDPVTNLAVDLEGFKTISLTWTNPSDDDLSHVELWYNTIDNFSTATHGSSFRSEEGVVTGLEVSTQYWFWAVAVDHFGNRSDVSNSAIGTTRQLFTDEMADLLVTAAKLDNKAVLTQKINDAAIQALQLDTSSVTTTKLANAAVEAGKIASLAVGTTHLQALAVTEAKVAASAITTSKIANAAVEQAKIAANAVGASQLASEAVTTAKIAPLAVDAAKLATNAVTTTKIADDAISTPKLQANSIVGDKIAANTIAVRNLLAGSFDNLIENPGFEFGLAPHFVASNGGAVGWSVHTSANARSGERWLRYDTEGQSGISAFNLNSSGSSSSGNIFAAGGDRFYFEVWIRAIGSAPHNTAQLRVLVIDSAGGHLSDDRVNLVPTTTYQRLAVEVTAPAGAALVSPTLRVLNDGNHGAGKLIAFDDCYARRMVEGSIIVDGAIVAAKIAADAVTAGKIAAGAVQAGSIASGAVTTAKLDALAVTADKIAANAITTAKVAANAITTNELAANSVQAANIAANAVQAGAIASGAVTTDKLAANVIDAGKIQAGVVSLRHLIAGSFDNLIQNPGFETDTLEPHVVTNQGGAIGWHIRTSANARSGARWLAFQTDNQTGIGAIMLNGAVGDGPAHFMVAVGDRIYSEVWVRAIGAGSHNRAQMRLIWLDSSGSQTGIETAVLDPVTTTYQKITITDVAPPGTSWAVINLRVLHDGNHGTNKFIAFDDVYCRKMVEGSIIVDGAILAQHIEAGAVVAGKVAANAIGANEIAANAVIAAKIAGGAVIADKIASGAVTTAKLDASAVTADKIAANAITTVKVNAQAITTDKITIGGVTTDRIATNAVSAINSGFTAGNIDVTSTSYTTVASTTLTANGGNVALDGSVQYFQIMDGATNQFIDMRLARGTTTIVEILNLSVRLDNERELLPINALDSSPGSGSTTYNLQIRRVSGTGSVRFRARFIRAMEFKR